MSFINFGIGRAGAAVPLPENVRYVVREEDFGTVSPGSHIDVEPNRCFVLNAPVIQTLPFIIPDGANMGLLTTCKANNTLTYTNPGAAQFQGVNASLSITDVSLDGSGTATAFNLSGGAYSLKFPDFNNYAAWGTLAGATDIYMPGVFADLLSGGLNIIDPAGGTITENLIVADSGGPFSVFNISGGSTESVQIFDNILVNNANVYLANIDPGTFPSGGRVQLTRNRVDLPDNLFAPGSVNETDPRVLASDNQGAKNSTYTGSWFMNGNSTATTITAADVFQNINSPTATVSPDVERFSLTGASIGELTYNGLEVLRGAFVAQISAVKTASTRNYSFAVAVNGVPLLDRQVVPFEVKTTTDSVALATPITLNPGDTVKVMVRADGHSDDVTIVAANVVVQ